MTRVTDNQGRTIGYLDGSTGSDGRQRVLNNNYQTVGYVSNRGTFNANDRNISSSKLPGLLLKG